MPPDLVLGGDARPSMRSSRTKRFGRLAGLLEQAGERLARVLLFALAEADDEGVVAVLLLGALADDGEIALDDGAALTVPSSSKNWVMPSFLPMMPGFVFML